MPTLFNIPLTKRMIAGLVLIYVAGLGWFAELIVPFLNISHKGPIWIAILVSAEVCFLAGVALLGKPVYRELKSRLQAYVKRSRRP